MTKFLKKPEVLLVLFALSGLFLGIDIASLIKSRIGSGKELFISIMSISGWIFLTVFFFYFYLKGNAQKKH